MIFKVYINKRVIYKRYIDIHTLWYIKLIEEVQKFRTIIELYRLLSSKDSAVFARRGKKCC